VGIPGFGQTRNGFTEAFPDLRLLTFDRRIAENAEALGIG
jgi:hypothetical protein